MHCLGFSIYSNGCEKRTVCPLLFHSYLLFKHSFYIIPQFMVFLQVKFGFSILFKFFLTPQTRLFPGFFRSFSNFLKKIKKSACNLPESKIYYASRLTRPVGQGVKTSPSHGENTSSILVLAARNFRSDSEVFLFTRFYESFFVYCCIFL